MAFDFAQAERLLWKPRSLAPFGLSEVEGKPTAHLLPLPSRRREGMGEGNVSHGDHACGLKKDDMRWLRHCERREAIQSVCPDTGLLRDARNDGLGQTDVILL